MYVFKKKLFSRQGEACKVKIGAGKTPRSVSLHGGDSAQC